ncbi:MAG: hypothetical protein ABFR82_12625 [Nitrospirota bacterium]
MKILLIGNFAPPYEEENLHNFSMLRKLEEEGHSCSVINISENPSKDKRFVDGTNMFDFTLKLVRFCRGKDVVHFFTKGYLRLGLLKLMVAVVVGTFFRTKTCITIHSELFSMHGQMRSPVGGRQTLFTAFTLATRIICADKDTFDVAAMYMKKSNFELIPSFVYTPENLSETKSTELKKLESKKKVIVFSGLQYPSFIFEILKEALLNYPLPSETGIVISVSEKPSLKLQHVLQDTGKAIADNLIFIDADDIKATLMAYSRADLIVRPPSCEGKTFFKSFAVSVKKTFHTEDYVYFPSGLFFIKEGDTAEMCVSILNTMLRVEPGKAAKETMEDSYSRITSLYQE